MKKRKKKPLKKATTNRRAGPQSKQMVKKATKQKPGTSPALRNLFVNDMKETNRIE